MILMTEQSEKKPHELKIQIDRTHYEVTKSHMTGAEIRAVPNPDIGPDRDLFEIRNGMRFFTAPAHINPGHIEKWKRK
jgi:hypothetical protein